MNILESMQENYDTLTKTQKKIADYLMNNIEKACFLSLKELAQNVSVSEVTILNFSKKLGLSNYSDIKKSLQAHITNIVGISIKNDLEMKGLTNKFQIYEEYRYKEIERIRNTYEAIDPGLLFSVVERIKKAKTIHIYGHKVSHVAAKFMELRLKTIGFNNSVVNTMDEFDVMFDLVNTDKEDLVFVFSFPYYSRHTINIMDYLKSVHANTITITDRIDSPIYLDEMNSIIVNTEHPIYFNSLTAVFSVIDMIMTILVLEGKERFERYRKLVWSLEDKLQNDWKTEIPRKSENPKR
ncbi:MurR/RpiR family transcriptional regulator [Clostridiaceae bacterium HFYG-1003]|nr:MurR/RpiR family transcriptional regulator [Clostridiaceae bacterium HFYG-1003]